VTDRVLEIADRPARLRLEYDNIVVEGEEGELGRVPLRDLAAVILAHPRLAVTHAVLEGLARCNVSLIVCDARRMPAGMLMPLQAHFLQAERFRMQAAMSQPQRKRLWKQVVRAKVVAQAQLVESVTGDSRGLKALAQKVRSGDPANVEARAAITYWRALMPGARFRRDPDAGGLNAVLNYGYAVVRAGVARAIVGAGLHPSVGLHHHNRYNAFCLADDLMEPYRPLVDAIAVRLRESGWAQDELGPEQRRMILEALSGGYRGAEETRTLSDWFARMAFSLVKVLEHEREDLDLPALPPRVG